MWLTRQKGPIMYVRTDGLGRVQTLSGSFAGTLGEPPLPPKIQNFLNRVKGNPQDYEALLLVSTFHVEPWVSDQLYRIIGDTYAGTDSLDEGKARQDQVIQVLQGIQQTHLSDKQFSELVNREKQLIQLVSNAFQKRIKELETKEVRWLEDILIKALLADYPGGLFDQVGKNFVLFTLPPEIAERVLNSRVPETHYARLGKALLLIAEQRQKGNAAFKKRVEQERKKRGK
jgi:hypothetical protein